ncbi:MAG: type II toxin-antitoxin system HigA family antitoxin [Candidatus Obscuribacterales bacterium]
MNTVKKDDGYMRLVIEFPLVPIRSDEQAEQAARKMKELAYRRSELSPGELDYLGVLGSLIAEYEKKLPGLSPEMSPREALAFLMQENDLKQTDLVELVGHKSNLSAFLNGNRGLSKRAAIRLADFFKVSPGLFLQ